MNCEPCGKVFTGIAPYHQHLESEKHKKKLAMLNYMSGSKPEMPQLNGACAGESSRKNIHCPVCSVSFESILQFQNHSMSLEHANNVQKKTINSAQSSVLIDVSSTTVNSIPSEDSIFQNDDSALQKDDSTIQKVDSTSQKYGINLQKYDSILPNMDEPKFSLTSYCQCKVCDKQFSGPEPYKQHMESAVHRKKVEAASHLVNQNQIPIFKCEDCVKSFSGPIPFQQHMVSDVHKKKLKQLELLKKYTGQASGSSDLLTGSMEVDSISSPSITAKTSDSPQLWFCSVCSVQCSGPAPYGQHIKGETHAKNLKRKELLSGQFSNDGIDQVQDSGLPRSGAPSNHYPMLHVGLSNSMDIENDWILPDLNNFALKEPRDLNITEFKPDDKIDFDAISLEENVPEIVRVEGMEAESEKKVNKDCHVENVTTDEEPKENLTCSTDLEEYEKCELCDVMLASKEETKAHFESFEHIKKKYPEHFVQQ